MATGETLNVQTPAPEITDILHVVHPAKDTEEYQRRINASFPDAKPAVVETDAKPENTHEKLAAHHHRISKNTLVVILAGDGTANMYGAHASHPETPEEVREAQLFIGNRGTACDTALSFNTRRRLETPELWLSDPYQRQIRKLHPATVISYHPDKGREAHQVMSYAGLNANAEGAFELDKARHELDELAKEHPWLAKIKEFHIAVKPGFSCPTFSLLGPKGEIVTDIVDALWMNGPRMAKYGRSQASHFEPEMHQTFTRAPFGKISQIGALGINGALLKAGHLPHTSILPADRVTWEIAPSKGRRAVRMQFDGETTLAAGPLTFTEAAPLNVIATR